MEVNSSSQWQSGSGHRGYGVTVAEQDLVKANPKINLDALTFTQVHALLTALADNTVVTTMLDEGAMTASFADQRRHEIRTKLKERMGSG